MRVQARITLPDEVRRDVDALRLRWNPERSAGNPAHVTIAYHDEAPDPDLLAERLYTVAAVTAPFRLTVGAAARFPDPSRGIYLRVFDPSDGVAGIREAVLAPPFHRRDRFGLHVTVLHPDHGDRHEAAWPEASVLAATGPFTVSDLQLVGPGNRLLATVGLSRPR